MNHRLLYLLTLPAALLISSALYAAGVADVIRVEQPYARAVPPGQPNSAVFMALTNTDETDHALVAAASDASEVVELHTHRMEDGMMRMRKIDRIDLPAGEKVTLEPGGLHVMLIGLRGQLEPGAQVALELRFEDGSQASLAAPVKTIEAAMGHPDQP